MRATLRGQIEPLAALTLLRPQRFKSRDSVAMDFYEYELLNEVAVRLTEKKDNMVCRVRTVFSHD